MSDTFTPFKTKRYIAVAKEPIFVGTGGYRIGRVDNTIIRDPSTNLPKIPGSTISGNARYYSWLSYKSEGMDLSFGCAKGKKTNDESACGTCPVCLTYGFINDDSAQSGLAYFSDARILLFPVATMIGTVWVTSDEIVEEFFEKGSEVEISEKRKFKASSKLESSLPKNNSSNKILNFGWVMLEEEGEIDFSGWELKRENENIEVYDFKKLLNEIESRICIVSKDVFHHIVNSNLETRTSVSINPITGATESGALFTYEALPRGTVFVLDVTYENPKNYGKPEPIELVVGTVEKGFELFSTLGIGGMGTRGFGKFEVKKNGFLSEKDFWNSIKEYIEKLQQMALQLKEKIETEGNELNDISVEVKEKDIRKLCKKVNSLNYNLNLWKAHIESQKEKLKKEIKDFQEIYDTISRINIEIPEKCNEEVDINE